MLGNKSHLSQKGAITGLKKAPNQANCHLH